MSFFKELKSDFYKERSILTVTDIIKWKKKRGLYNFKKLPETVIITPKTTLIKGFKKFKHKKLKGLSGKNYLLNKNYLLSTEFGNGSSAIIMHLEELRVFGVKNIFFIGFAGMISSKLKEGDIYLVSNAYSIAGASFYYSDNELLNNNNKLSKLVKGSLKLKEITCLSVDIPYRETKSLINYYKQKNVSLIDMETASIIAFSNFYNLECACVLVASDRIANNNWSAPKNLLNLILKIDQTINKIIVI